MKFENIKNGILYYSDNIKVLSEIKNKSIDLIYLDPPFNKNRHYYLTKQNASKDVSFKDVWSQKDIKEEWLTVIKNKYIDMYNFIESVKNFGAKGTYFYLIYIAIRLIECHRILKDTASIYIHSDPSINSYIKILMDIIFGVCNFQNEIVWCYKSGGASSKRYAKKHDTILFYSKTKNYYFNAKKEKSYHGLDYTTGNKNIVLHEDENGKYTLVNMKDYWEIPMMATSSKKRIGYPTEKPMELISRIIEVSSKKGDIILDPFAGSGIVCVSAEIYMRKWIGVDISFKAFELIKKRLEKACIE